ncbi:glycosyl hydrolase family 25 [Apilactobacillus ozensis DSM 23829 = JCM 17196]|uniref:Glycosyl hydrolase family 25 n=1 Tax=Apilactobacillus ozensis DSM 23829 = JCM 17196 TaxID=1423781 RepID=A0A0R2AZS3_9LACO|nr:GH25 family lysozyme [Apilactobacillus ozensis]KRM69209.1 glycosyl hydrolase family 25 [Apilactobacillus ozensis DSM 23829 = JCM 17196]
MVRRRADISVWQSDSVAFMKDLKTRYGVDMLSVQVSYGNPAYDNKKAGNQIAAGFKVFDEVGAYHFYLGNPAEAKHFISRVESLGFDKSTELMMDVEGSLSGNLTAQINEFLDYCYSKGYHNLAVYYNESFGLTRVNSAKLHHNPKLWIAKYSSVKPACDYDIWQYTQTAYTPYGDVDLSFDYSKPFKPIKSDKPDEYYSDGTLFKITAKVIPMYHDDKLTDKRKVKLGKGSVLYATPIKVGKNKQGTTVYRLKTAIGYMTANKKWIDKVK